MNRILKNSDNNSYQVLVTPTYVSSPSMEIFLGNFMDEKIRGYYIKEFRTLQDAMDLAFKYPSIDWNKLVNMHEDSYVIITNTIKKALANSSFIVEIDSHLMDPTELKETMFKRVAHYGERFSLFYDANDIISVNIINPWTRNVNEMANLLKVIPELHIKKIIRTKTHLTLIGRTDVDTVYEIRLWTSMIAQWARWIHINNLNPRAYIGMLSQIIAKQKIIDDGDIVR